MYERFTDRARKVMQLANQSALNYSHGHIGPEHILLGLIKDSAGIGTVALRSLGFDIYAIEAEVGKRMVPGLEMVMMGKLPQTPRARHVIEQSIEYAKYFKHNYIGTEHILCGLLAEPEGIVSDVFKYFNICVNKVIDEIKIIVSSDEIESELVGADKWVSSQEAQKLFYEKVQTEIDSLPCIYILFGCRLCGLPWNEHKESCCEHKKKDLYVSYLQLAKNIKKYDNLFKLAKANGWSDSEDTNPDQSYSWTANFGQVVT